MNIILGIISAFFYSVADSFWKKSVEISTLPKPLFNIFWPATWLIIIYIIIIFSWMNIEIFFDYKIIWIIILIASLNFVLSNIEMWIYKRVKLSNLLPYSNLDKIFVVIIWFIVFYWTKNSTSLTSFLITLFTIFIIIIFSVDLKKLTLSKDILKFFFTRFLSAVNNLLIWYILIKYTTIDYISLDVIAFLWINILFAFLAKNNFIELLKQKKGFYKYRFWATIIGWIWFIIWLYIVQTSGILIATLLSFISLVFSIFSMKIILWDSPTKKQIILAFIVMLLIWIWYYFK